MDAGSNEPRSYTASARDVAEHFGVNRATVYNWIDTTDIPHRRIGGTIRFNLAEVDEWSASRPEAA